METNKRINIERIFYWSLTMVLITLPFPKYSLNSQSIILLALVWLCYNSFNEKISIFKLRLREFFVLSGFFWLSILRWILMKFSNDGLAVVVDNLPFLIIPLVLLSVEVRKSTIQFCLRIFSFSVIIASIFALIKALYLHWNNLGSYFYYSEFSKILEVHTTYFALFLVVAFIYFFYDFMNFRTMKKWQNVCFMGCLLINLYITSSRISIVAIGLFLLIYIAVNLNKLSIKIRILITLLSIGFIVFYFSSPNFQNRNSSVNDFGTEIPDVNSRLVHWEAVWNSIRSENILFGDIKGTADEKLINQYKELNFVAGYRFKYNAHNQYLESIFNFGLIGFISLIGIFVLGIHRSINFKNNQWLSIIIIISVFMITESILERQRGIVLFITIMTLITACTKSTGDKTISH